MATKIKTLAVLLFFVNFVYSDTFDSILDDVSSCKDTCRNTYTPHTFEKSTSEECCNRGCRLYSMMEFIYDDVNKTTETCIDSCKEAYEKPDEFEACKMGCESQKPFSMNLSNDLDSIQNIHLVNPFNYVQQMYSSLMSNIMSQTATWSSWVVYMRDGDGSIIVVKSPTSYRVDIGDPNTLTFNDEDNTASFMETNLIPVDNSATPFLKNSQYSGQLDNDDLLSLSQRDLSSNEKQLDYNSSDWLSCISRKTGMPRLILSWLLLMCAVVMIWLSLSAAVTGPDQRVVSDPQKLSINGDEEVIAALLANGIKPSYPQNEDKESAISLLNIKVQRV